MASRNSSARNSMGMAVAALAAALLALAACSSGPTDFVEVAAPPSLETTVKTDVQRTALERELTAQGQRQVAAGSVADSSLPAAMALQVARDQQSEDVRALLDSAGIQGATEAALVCAEGLVAALDGTCVKAP
jgi:hypothetical protein